ncbi:ITR-like protein [Mya arenaria]|uniref:ITR-like protein n=1 Tax=Mya arenaria TaxID=6604 RepID=A0ABY7DN64_MYAAR|nr:ITR-like protein [Mya arenaria]
MDDGWDWLGSGSIVLASGDGCVSHGSKRGRRDPLRKHFSKSTSLASTWVAFAVFFIPFVMLNIYENFKKGFAKQQCQIPTRERKDILTKYPLKFPARAKIKTLKMTFVILLTFIICSMPYFVVEMIMSYGKYCLI